MKNGAGRRPRPWREIGRPARQCRRCHGNGRLWGDTPWRHNHDGANEETCPDCDGAGTVATPSPSAAAFVAD